MQDKINVENYPANKLFYFYLNNAKRCLYVLDAQHIQPTSAQVPCWLINGVHVQQIERK